MLVSRRFQSADIEPSLAPFAKWDICESGGHHSVFLYSCNANFLTVESYVKGTHGFDYKEMNADCLAVYFEKKRTVMIIATPLETTPRARQTSRPHEGMVQNLLE